MRTILSSFGFVCLLMLAGAQPFTYQGFLKESGNPANGTYQMTFRLFSVPSGGTALATVGPVNVSVSNGLFTQELNFGNVWTGADRYLEIQVGSTTLSPRVKINPTPYANTATLLNMFQSGTTNPDRMVITHSPAFTNWGLQYRDIEDAFHFVGDGISRLKIGLGEGRIEAPGTLIAGMVGVGTGSPNYLLDVNGRARIRGTTGANTAGIWYSNGTVDRAFIGLYDDNRVGMFGASAGWHLMMSVVNGSVFVGPTSLYVETGKLNVATDSHLNHATLRLHELGNDGPRIEFTNSVNTARKWHIWGYIGSAVADDRLNFWNSSAGDIMSIRGDGTVAVKVLEITGADLAEKFPTTDAVEPGMVVEIDPDNPGHLRKARGAYNRRVAGVVAGANGLSKGIVLGNLEGSENHTPIAISGRVWVYADATQHAIEPGDLLTTSEKPGYAMVARDARKAQGAILGKAMTRLEKGKTGMVLVLVNLQ